MINYWYELTTNEAGLHGVAIIANSDMVNFLEYYDSEKEAEVAGEAFIAGLKLGRGEQ